MERIHQPKKRGYHQEAETKDVEESILAEIHSALTTKQRCLVLNRVEQLLLNDENNLSHTVTFKSSLITRNLLEGGILSALILQLNYVLQRHGTTVKEVEQLCWTIHWLTRHCPGEVRHQASTQIENPNFLELLSR